MANFGPLRAEIGSGFWSTPANFNQFRVLPVLLYGRRSPEANQPLHDIWPSPALLHYIHYGGCCPLVEFCQVRNSLYVQVLRSPILAALLHGTWVVGVSQNLWRRTRNGITERLQRASPIFGWAAITLDIGPHSSSFLICNHFTWYSFQTVWSCYIQSFFYHLLCHKKIHFGAEDHLDHLHIRFLFLCRGNNPLYTLPTLLILHPCLFQIFCLPFSVLYLFPYCFSNILIHHHVSLCLQGPFEIPHMCCAVSIIIFFILCQCLSTSRCFHSSSSTLFPTMLLYSSQVCSSLNYHTCTLGLNSYAIFLLY